MHLFTFSSIEKLAYFLRLKGPTLFKKKVTTNLFIDFIGMLMDQHLSLDALI